MKTVFNPIIVLCILIGLANSGCNKSEKKPEETTPAPNYTNVKINSVKLVNMSFLDASSAGWDATTGPDVYFKTLDPSSTVVVLGGTSWNITTGSLPISWNLSTPLQITNLGSQYTFQVWDDDSDAINPDDYIYGYYFTPNSYKSGYPTTITLQSGTNPLKLELVVTWH